MSCPSVCLSVKSHLTSGAFVLPENCAMYSVDNEGRKIGGVFSETASFQSYSTSYILRLPSSPPFSHSHHVDHQMLGIILIPYLCKLLIVPLRKVPKSEKVKIVLS